MMLPVASHDTPWSARSEQSVIVATSTPYIQLQKGTPSSISTYLQEAGRSSRTFHSSYQLNKKLLCYLSTKAAVYILALGKFYSNIEQWVCQPVYLMVKLLLGSSF